MGGNVTLVMGIHCHQPVGNFDWVFEEAYRKSYSPFVKMLEAFPDIPMTLHFTGILYEWLESHHPELLELMRKLVDRGQVEIMTGGFYEPIMPAIPDRDKKGQIRQLTRYIRQRFGDTPIGMWLAERVWEPYMCKPLAQAGVRYLTMDDSHFKAAGLEGEALHGYYYTEEQGEKIAVFPISEDLRYLIPFKRPEETIRFLRSLASPDGRHLLVIADDGEKFGVWPGTHEWVYEKEWLRQFFEALRENSDWLSLMTFRQALKAHQSLGAIYIPNASYTEMMEWVLPPRLGRELQKLAHEEDPGPYGPFLRGGFWRNFLVKYRESTNLHRKMLYVSDRVQKLRGESRKRGEKALWTGQCNCGYWHGVFGGIYLNHIRQAIYTNLIAAEKIADEVLHPSGPWIEVEEADFFREGGSCVLAQTDRLNLYFDLDHGGQLFELDHKPKCFNVLNTMTRREEAYHAKVLNPRPAAVTGESARSIHDLVIFKEEGLADHLVYDRYRRTALIEHFLGGAATLDEFARNRALEEGEFVNRPYEASWVEENQRVSLEMRREGRILRNGDAYPLLLTKVVEIKGGISGFGFRHSIRLLKGSPLLVRFGVEFGFALQAGNTPDRYYVFPDTEERPLLGETGERQGIAAVSLFEEWIGLEVRLSFSRNFDLWYLPIETISSSEGGFERIYQSSVVLPHWELELVPGRETVVEGRLELIDLQEAR